MTDVTLPDVAGAPVAEAPVADEPVMPTGGSQQPSSRRRKAVLILLLVMLGAFLLFAGWYLITRKPITEFPLPGVTLQEVPHYSFSIYGVTAPTGVAVSADGSRIYATQTEGETKVVAFDGNGNPVATLMPPPSVPGNHVPVYVAVHPQTGNVYVSDRAAGELYVYAPDGTFLRTFDPGDSLRGWAPLGLAFDAKGDLFVTSVGAPYQGVHEFGPTDDFIRSYGKDSDLNFPNGVAVDATGKVYVADSNNGRLLVFDETGATVGVVKRGASKGDLGLPRGSAIDDSGRIYVADISFQGVHVYKALTDGRSPEFVGDFGVEGSGDGAFLFPNSVAVDGRSHVYVADWRNGRIQVWTY